MILPKVGILKKRELDDRGHYRYYSPNYDPESSGKLSKKNRPKMPLLNLNNYPQIKSEKQLMHLIYSNWGEGNYLILAYAKGRRGLWVFWHGKITNEGFIFFKKGDSSKKDNFWKEQDWEFEKIKENLNKEEVKNKRYGFLSYLKHSGRRGTFIPWKSLGINHKEEEKWIKNEQEKKEVSWGENKKERGFEKWS